MTIDREQLIARYVDEYSRKIDKFEADHEIQLPKAEILNFVVHGYCGGHFLTALFGGELYKVFQRGDDTNLAMLRELVMFCHNHLPMGAIGTPERAASWMNRGGLIGIDAEVLKGL